MTWTQDRHMIPPSSRRDPYENDQLDQQFYDEKATDTPLHYASAFDLPEICKWLLDCGCKVDYMSRSGTPLHYALAGPQSLIYRGMDSRPFGYDIRYRESILKVVDILLEAGADPNIKSSAGKAPLHYAYSEKDIILRLLKKGARYKDGYQRSLRHCKARKLLNMIGRENLHVDDYFFLLERAIDEGAG